MQHERLLEQFGDYTGPAELGRAVYDFVDCGPWIAFVRQDGTEVYYSDAPQTWEELGTLAAIKVGSIVEGVDASVGPYIVEVEPLGTLKDRFFATTTRVNEEANAIFEEEMNDDAA